jgi:multidrug efflux system membrane fusion protein
MFKQPSFWLLIAITSLGALLYSNVATQPDQTADINTTKKVRVAEAQKQLNQRNPTFAGVVRAKNRANLAFSDSSGRLEVRKVETGDLVKANQVIAKLDNRAHQHAVNAAKANIADIEARQAQNQRDITRVAALVEKKAATAEELEVLQAAADSFAANLEAARVQLAEAERRLKETTLLAPFDGTVTDVYMEPGEFATPGMPVVSLSGSNRFEIEIEVPESILPNLSNGQSINITFPLQQDRAIEGSIISIGQASQNSRLFPILIEPTQNKGLIAGMSAEVTLAISQAETTTIPVTAVINPGGQHPTVFRVNGQQVERLSVDVSDLIGTQIAVEGDLAPGDTVVIGGHAGLVDGDQVEVVQ